MDITSRIGEIRKSKGITQKTMADQLGMDQGNYSKLEKRGSKMTIEQLQSIADALGTSLGEVIGIEGKTGKVENSKVKELEKELVRYQDSLSVALDYIKLKKHPLDKLAEEVERQVTYEIILTAIQLSVITKKDCTGWFLIDEPIHRGSSIILPIDTDYESLEKNGYKENDATISRVMSEKQIIETLPSISNRMLQCLHALYSGRLAKDEALYRSLHNYYNTFPMYRGNERIGQ